MNKSLELKAIQDTTLRYYSHFCGADLAKLESGLHFICSSERDRVLKGFGCKYTLFIFVRDSASVISYSPQYHDFIESVKKSGADNILSAVQQKYKLKQMRMLMFHGEKVTQYGDARVLSPADYSLYEAFFRAIHPSANPDGWLYAYFTEKAAKGYLTGCIKDGHLVSVCDAPDMPYMENKIQHTGIATLVGERRKGYARCAAALSTHLLIENGVCPQWECDADNIASFELAKSIGYNEFGRAYILEE